MQDFLAFAEDRSSSRRLRSLKSALEVLLPGNPGVMITLQEAIRAKSPARPSQRGKRERAAEYSVPFEALPAEWRYVLGAMRRGEDTNGLPPPAESRIKNMEEVLHQYAWVLIDAGLPVEITVTGVRLAEQERTDRAKERSKKKKQTYSDEGDRPRLGGMPSCGCGSSRSISVSTCCSSPRKYIAPQGGRRCAGEIRQDGQTAGPDGDMATRAPPSRGEPQRADTGDEAAAAERGGDHRALDAAAAPSRRWPAPLGEDVGWDGGRYRIDVDTQKADVALRGRLHPRLTPVLDALLLGGVDPTYLDVMRKRVQADSLPLFRETTGRMLSTGYPSTVWRAHMGTGAHIARTRVHTELGRLGPEGVEAALALCAQRDPRTAAAYQEKAVARAMMERGQAMIEELFEELEPLAAA